MIGLAPGPDSPPTITQLILLRFNDQSGNTPTPVGTYEKGRSIYGVYDMAGNAQEWVADWYSKNFYENSLIANPTGPVFSQYRVLRGGTWYDNADKVRASARSFSEPEEALLGFGFRCAKKANP